MKNNGGSGSTERAPDLASGARLLRRRVLAAEIVALLALLLAAFAAWRAYQVRQSHVQLVEQLNRERSGVRGVLKAAGIPEPLGKVVEEIIAGPSKDFDCKGLDCRRCGGRGCNEKGRRLAERQRAAREADRSPPPARRRRR